MECEICKGPYPETVKLPSTGEEVELLNFQVHEDAYNYVIIESVTSSTNKTMHVCNFDQSNLIKIGRG